VIGGAGGGVDDLDHTLRRVVAAETQAPAFAADEAGERVVAGVRLDRADLDGAEVALLRHELAVDEQQAGAIAEACRSKG
jgi:hypothetical protein